MSQLLSLAKKATPFLLRQRARPLISPYILTPKYESTLAQKPFQPMVPFKKTFDKLLVANRGEIACRIIKTARKMGIKTVAVYSDLDENALHVKLADEAVCIGSGASADSYLSIEHILDAVKATGANAVHPGYGFLSENPTFVRLLERDGITFVGPKATAIASMGDKIESKRIARESGVNCIPGYDGEVKTVPEAIGIANDIGYPVMMKASAGGGGKGMRIAWNDQQLTEGFKLAKQESKSSFGDDRMLIEKYIDHPRHIEVQVLGDNFGNVVYLPERECSIQRRNQKVIEESPSVHVDEYTRQKMGQQAVALAKHVNYNSAGTVEFLVDKDRNFYFLEMNTRLQVEHPITEFVTGLDLVEQMLYSAANQPLLLKQKDIKMNGWAFESRVYAEDPTKYLPSVGRLLTYQEPTCSSSVRCDSGFVEGSEMYVEYDPLICKLATHGSTRPEALQKMMHALDEYVIKGVTHNIPLLRGVFAHPRFQDGKEITTHFLAEEYPRGFQTETLKGEALQHLTAVVGALQIKKDKSHWQGSASMDPPQQLWVQITDEQSQEMVESQLTIQQLQDSKFKAISGENEFEFSTEWPLDGLLAHSMIGATNHSLVLQYLDPLALGFRIQHHGSKYKVKVLNQTQHAYSQYMKAKTNQEQAKVVSSPMPGRIISVSVKEGDDVIEGSELVVVEAMKMQNILRTPHLGKIKKIFIEPGNTVQSGQLLIEFEDVK